MAKILDVASFFARLHLLTQITPWQSSPSGSLGCATGLPRRNLGKTEMKTGGGGGSRTRVPTQLTMTSTCLFRAKLLIVQTFRPRTDTGTDYSS